MTVGGNGQAYLDLAQTSDPAAQIKSPDQSQNPPSISEKKSINDFTEHRDMADHERQQEQSSKTSNTVKTSITQSFVINQMELTTDNQQQMKRKAEDCGNITSAEKISRLDK